MTPTTQALDAYLTHLTNVREQLAELRARVNKQSSDTASITWGHVGDMAHLESNLAELLARFDK